MKKSITTQDFVYNNWKDAVTDSLSDAAGDASISSYGDNADDHIPYDNFDILEIQFIKYLKEVPGLHIFYFRPKKLWRNFLKFLKSRI